MLLSTSRRAQIFSIFAPSITAFQAKYLLRVFLRQFRDPAQALEELNGQMGAHARAEEFISLLVIVFGFDRHLATEVDAYLAHLAGYGSVVTEIDEDRLHYLSSAERVCRRVRGRPDAVGALVMMLAGIISPSGPSAPSGFQTLRS